MSDKRPAGQTGRLRERAAEEIRALLARRKMSAAELARRTGAGQTYLSRRMTGEIAFDLDDLEIIARELNVTVSELLGTDPQTTVANLVMANQPLAIPPKGPLPAARPAPARRRPARVESESRTSSPSFSPHGLVA